MRNDFIQAAWETVAVLGFCAVMAVLFWFMPAPARSRGGDRVVRYHKAYEVLGWLMTAGAVGFVLHVVLTAPAEDRVLAGSVFGGVGLAAPLFLWIVRRSEVAYNAERVVYTRLFAPSISFRWVEVAGVEYSAIFQSWMLRLSDGRTTWVSIYMDGFEKYVALAKKKAGAAVD